MLRSFNKKYDNNLVKSDNYILALDKLNVRNNTTGYYYDEEHDIISDVAFLGNVTNISKCKKIIAYLPIQNPCPVLENTPLLPDITFNGKYLLNEEYIKKIYLNYDKLDILLNESKYQNIDDIEFIYNIEYSNDNENWTNSLLPSMFNEDTKTRLTINNNILEGHWILIQ